MLSCSLVLLPACREPPADRSIAQRADLDTRYEAAVAGITESALRADVEVLASEAMAGRPTPSPELDAAADHLVDRLRAMGLRSPPGVEDHRQVFECGGAARPGLAANVLALVPGDGSTDEVVLVSAHYDHIGAAPSAADAAEDRVYNGANDDASGVAAALAIVGAAARLDPPPPRGVLFVAFCGEELGLRGSKHFVATAPVPLHTIVAGVNLEMLGRPAADAPRRAWITGMSLSTMGSVFDRANPEGTIEFVDGLAVGAAEGAAFDRSDNFPFARHGIVAHSISTGSIDHLYHSVDDEADTLDYAGMTQIVRGIARGVLELAQGAPPPVWTDAGREAGYGEPSSGPE